MREYFENEICANCCIDKQFCDRCGVRKKTANSEKEKPALMDRLYESDRNCDGNCKNCVAICGMTQNTIFLEAADAIEELLAKVPQWISVEERLPEDQGDDARAARGGDYIHKVLAASVTPNYTVMDTAYLENGIWSLSQYTSWKQIIGAPVTHWMPLPEPPKEDV